MKKMIMAVVIMSCFIHPALAATLKVAADTGVSSFDPHFFNETPTNSINYNVFDGLVNLDKDLKPYPVLAESWRCLDNVTWQFSLRKNIHFHNDNSFNADDVVWSINRAKHGENSGFKAFISAIEEAVKVDEYTINIITKGPYPILLQKLSCIRIMDKESSEDISDEELALHPVGTGPYKLELWNRGKLIILKANEHYFRGKPAIDTIRIIPLPDDEARATALLSNYADLLLRVPQDKVSLIQSDTRFNFFKKPGLRLIFLQMDQARDKSPYIKGVESNPLKDVRVRQAIYYGINEEAIVKSVMGVLGEPAAQYYPKEVNGYDETITRVAYDPEKARALLKEAGYENGFSLVLDTPNDRYINDEKIARTVALFLSKIGISVQVNAMPKKKFFPKVFGGDTSMSLLGLACVAGDGSELLDVTIHSYDKKSGFGVYNSGRYSNPKVDALIEESAKVLDESKRRGILIEAMHISLLEDQCIIPLHYQVDLYAAKKKLVMEPRSDTYLYYFDMKIEE